MAAERAQRRLAGILAIDVVGYSRVMETDEEGMLARLKALREELLGPKITEHHGRIVKTTGDGALVEFASAVDAVRCAVDLQRALAKRNESLPEAEVVSLRVGVNLGDIIIDGEDIYGTGVNVAARLEAIAEPGGICISGRVLDQVENNVNVGFAFLGRQKVKNIERPINTYAVLMDPADAGKVIGAPGGSPQDRQTPHFWMTAALAVLVIVASSAVVWYYQGRPDVEPARAEQMAFPLPDKPSIAVLPFDNFSGDPKEDYFADGITETLITTLSRIPSLFVIARNSAFAYQGKAVKVQQVAEELGVRYVLEGSVQRSDDRVRVNTQLVDALTGQHLWAKAYDRKAGDIFAVQDDIASKVAAEMEVQLTEGEQARIARGHAGDPQAYDLYLRARQHYHRYTKNDFKRAQQLYQRAVDIDPGFVAAWIGLGWVHQLQARFGWTDTPDKSRRMARDMALKARTLDPQDPGAYELLSQIALFEREFERANEHCEKALALAPETADTLAGCAHNFTYLGKPKEALRLIERAMRLSPYYPGWYLFVLGNAHRLLGNYEEALAALKAWQERLPNAPFPHIVLTYTYAEMGRLEDARAEAQELLEKWPDFSVEQQAKMTPYQDPAELELTLEGLRKAGVPEK